MINELVKTYLQPDLKREGFNKQGLTWNKKQDDFVQVLNIQKGRKSLNGSIDFTLNLGLFIFDVWNICWGKPIPKIVKAVDCFPSLRIGLLLAEFNPKCLDKWWILSNASDIEAVGIELKGIINKKCLPFFQQFQTKKDVEYFVESSIHILYPLDELYYSILKKINGDNITYKKIIGKLENNKHWGSRAKEIMSRLS